jgi:hypothetical protein
MLVARVFLWVFVIVVLLLTGPVLTLAFGPVSLKGNWATCQPSADRPRARSGDASRGDRSGLCQPDVRVARRLCRAHVARR